MSFILDALRKSDHERQRSALPGLAHVPLATPPAQVPRWAMIVIGVLAAAVLVLAGAWWQGTRTPAPVAATAPPIVERSVAVPPPAAPAVTAAPAPTRFESTPSTRPLADAAATSRRELSSAAAPRPATAVDASPAPAVDEPALPSAAALAAQGVTLPPLKLELHAFSERPSDRFVFINGRKFVEGERLPEGPELVAIQPSGAVLSYYGHRFLIVPE